MVIKAGLYISREESARASAELALSALTRRLPRLVGPRVCSRYKNNIKRKTEKPGV
jgi:hypothetical protein